MIWFLLWLMINKFLNYSATMIYQLFNKFNNLFVFDPYKKSRKLLTLWKIPTHALKVLICTKKRHWTFRITLSWHTDRLQKAGIVSEAWRQLGGNRRGSSFRLGPGAVNQVGLSWQCWGFESWLKCLQPWQSPGAGGSVAGLPSRHKNANVHSPIWILV